MTVMNSKNNKINKLQIMISNYTTALGPFSHVPTWYPITERPSQVAWQLSSVQQNQFLWTNWRHSCMRIQNLKNSAIDTPCFTSSIYSTKELLIYRNLRNRSLMTMFRMRNSLNAIRGNNYVSLTAGTYLKVSYSISPRFNFLGEIECYQDQLL